MERRLSDPQFCANLCELKEQAAPPCGSVFEHAPPFMTAESVCLRALIGRLEGEQALLAEGYGSVSDANTFSSIAWAESECGMAAPDDEIAAAYFESALDNANIAIRSPYSFFESSLSAALLHVYQPTFMALRQRVAPSRQEIRVVREGLGHIHDALYAAPIHMPGKAHIREAEESGHPHSPCLEKIGARDGMAAKLVGMMLAARKGILLHPGSHRESHAEDDFVAQNHDAYRLVGGEKYPIKLRLKSQSRATGGNLRIAYDERTTYINMKALVNLTVQYMKEQQRAQYDYLHRKNLSKPPDIVMIGHLLRTELNESLDHASRTLLYNLSERLLQVLFANQPEEPIILPETQNREAAWEILPADCLELADRDDTQEALSAAYRARTLYFRASNKKPGARRLQQLIGAMRRVKKPMILTTCVGAYIDLARSAETTPHDAVKLIEAAETIMKDFVAKDWREMDPMTIHLLFRCGLQKTYGEKYKLAVLGESPGLEEEDRHYDSLLKLTRKTLEATLATRGRVRQSIRGTQFEIAIHLLNTRMNVRNNAMKQVMWPSLPREDSPHDFNPSPYLTGWDAAVTRGAFLNQDPAACRFLQLKSVDDDGKLYDPAITVISGLTDLGAYTSDIIKALILEQSANPAVAAAASAELNIYEERFLQRLGW